jgi:transcriptional regulator with XRE-family HTH domain
MTNKLTNSTAQKTYSGQASIDANAAVSQLIKSLIHSARERGITQAELAKRAGLTAVGLSKAKSRGNIGASSLVKLAALLDLELALTPSQRQDKITESIKSGRYFSRKPHSEDG